MIIAANWKMNLGETESLDLYEKILDIETEHEVVVFPSITNLSYLAEEGGGLGLQNFYPKEEGAFTGEITLSQIPENVEYVLIGHSERRIILKESDELIREKVKFALSHKKRIILCIGESLEIYENGETLSHLISQLDSAIGKLPEHELENIVIAYEPIWAIGTGKTPTGEEVNKLLGKIRDIYKLPILYGGSVNEKNVNEFTSKDNIEGVLVGGASLDAGKFSAIVENC